MAIPRSRRPGSGGEARSQPHRRRVARCASGPALRRRRSRSTPETALSAGPDLAHSAFCLGGIVMQCAEGTKCTGSVNGQSPCTWDYPASSCPGPYDDYQCINRREYCYGGVKVECKSGTACTGPTGSGTCCEPILLDNQTTTASGCTGNCAVDATSSDSNSHVVDTCSRGDWKCVDDKTYCDGRHSYTCPRGTVCKGEPPCVKKKKHHCTEVPKKCDSSGNKDWGCLNDYEFCHGGEVLGCPDGTACTGSVNGSSPCTPNAPTGSCGGHWSDWQCMDLNSYCVGGHAFNCPKGQYCTTQNSDHTPCTTAYTPTTCTSGDGVCTSDNAFCQGGITYFLPSDLVCVGTAPPVVDEDDTCSDADNVCLNHGKFCYKGEVYSCTDGYSCTGSVDGANPCTPDAADPICADWDDYSCVDANHYCLGGQSYECASSKPWCVDSRDSGEDPCTATAPVPTCAVPNDTCVNVTTFCSANVSYNCPSSMDCKGKPGYPCVYTEGECPPGPKPHPECSNPDYTCLDNKDYCYKGEILTCCDGTRCKAGHGCVEEKHPPKCPSGCVDYQCLDLEHFCLGGHAMSCPDGTACTGKPGPASPCRSNHVPTACPKGEWGCTSSRSYCVQGVEFDCPLGALCIGGKGPCVYPTTDEPGGYGN